jgi:hypothetical protein
MSGYQSYQEGLVSIWRMHLSKRLRFKMKPVHCASIASQNFGRYGVCRCKILSLLYSISSILLFKKGRESFCFRYCYILLNYCDSVILQNYRVYK